MNDAVPMTPVRPRSRLRLFLPFGLLALLVVAWTAGWFVLRGRVEAGLDAALAREANAGRSWTCADRSVSGYPFRFEVGCASLGFVRADFAWRVGRVLAVAQVYRPTHVVLEATGPLEVSRGPITAKATWRLLQASVQVARENGAIRLDRLSVAVDGLAGRAEPPPEAATAPVDFAARHVEFHARPNPARFEGEGAADASLRAEGVTVPILDPLLGGAEPADIALDVTASRAAGFGGRPLPIELERWRAAGGAIDVTLLSVDKGPRRLRVRGALALDPQHRLAGRLNAEAAGLEAILAPVLGARLGGQGGAVLGGLLGGLLGGGRQSGPRIDQAPAEGGPRLLTLPPVMLEGGRVRVGPFPLPVVLLPLY